MIWRVPGENCPRRADLVERVVQRLSGTLGHLPDSAAEVRKLGEQQVELVSAVNQIPPASIGPIQAARMRGSQFGALLKQGGLEQALDHVACEIHGPVCVAPEARIDQALRIVEAMLGDGTRLPGPEPHATEDWASHGRRVYGRLTGLTSGCP